MSEADRRRQAPAADILVCRKTSPCEREGDQLDELVADQPEEQPPKRDKKLAAEARLTREDTCQHGPDAGPSGQRECQSRERLDITVEMRLSGLAQPQQQQLEGER